jgi:hypothetical protein
MEKLLENPPMSLLRSLSGGEPKKMFFHRHLGLGRQGYYLVRERCLTHVIAISRK